jgi:hypothetical protein
LDWDDAEKQQQINTYLSELKFFQSEAKS